MTTVPPHEAPGPDVRLREKLKRIVAYATPPNADDTMSVHSLKQTAGFTNYEADEIQDAIDGLVADGEAVVEDDQIRLTNTEGSQ